MDPGLFLRGHPDAVRAAGAILAAILGGDEHGVAAVVNTLTRDEAAAVILVYARGIAACTDDPAGMRDLVSRGLACESPRPGE